MEFTKEELQQEEWKYVVGEHSKIMVSSIGRVWDCIDSRFLKYFKSHGYLLVYIPKHSKKKGRLCRVHVLIAESFLSYRYHKKLSVVNHIDYNRSNSKLYNLEIVTVRENTNSKHIKSSSKYVGVCFCKQTKKWKSAILINGNSITIGRFNEEYIASKAYNIALNNEKCYSGDNSKFRKLVKSLL
jgi:hypothetical protein